MNASAAALPDALRLGATHLTVSDLDRSVAFYTGALGLRLHRREDPFAALGAGGEDLLVLRADPGAPLAGRGPGLYHVALLHPSRPELARAAARLAAMRTPIRGASDHRISEAIYLFDPDGIEIELAADRPRDAWPDLADPLWDGGRPEPLDLQALLELVRDEQPAPHVDPATVIGHLHLHVGDLDPAVAHYRDVLGFAVMTSLPGASFLAAGGYHHHVGVNTWRGQGPGPAPGAIGLRHWEVVLDDAAQVAAVRDRAAAAGAPREEHDAGGVLVRDPWGMAALFTTRDLRA